MALTQLIDNTWRESGVATAAGTIVQRSKSLFGASLHQWMIDRCKVLREFPFSRFELTFDPN
jgi:hypothetical protein